MARFHGVGIIDAVSGRMYTRNTRGTYQCGTYSWHNIAHRMEQSRILILQGNPIRKTAYWQPQIQGNAEQVHRYTVRGPKERI